MSSFSQATKLLGDYMLKGWIMTDESCRVEGCNVPIMLSRDRTQRICVVHDLQPDSGSSQTAAAASSIALPDTSKDVNVSRTSSRSRAGSVASHDGQLLDKSRPSTAATPPTPLSNGPASPTFVLPEPSEEVLRRRRQSDLASQRIGRKMLQGYAMLGEECQNPDCVGVPLVRPPRKDGTRAPRMECVICENVYTEARDPRGFTTLKLVEPASLTAASSAGNSASGTSGAIVINTSHPVAVTATDSEKHAATLGPSKANQSAKSKEKDVIGTSSEMGKPGKTRNTTVTSSNVSALKDVLGSIDRSLVALSSRLDSLSKCDDASVLNASSFEEVAKQMNALLETRQAVRRELDATS